MVKFEDIIYAYLQARKNKRRSHDSVVFELNQEQNLVRLWESVNNRTLDTTDNYTFVAKEPHIREIFATAMSVRVIHHYLEWRLRPIYEKLLPRNSFNNRKNMGLPSDFRFRPRAHRTLSLRLATRDLSPFPPATAFSAFLPARSGRLS